MLVGLVCALLAGSAQASTVTIGSPLTASFVSASFGNPLTIANPVLTEPGAQVASPVDGTIVRWRIEDAAGGPFKLRVLTRVGTTGSTYTGAGTSAPQSPSSLATQTFPADLPIRAGQILGLDNTNGSDQLGRAAVSGTGWVDWEPPLADGATRAASVGGAFEFAFNADVQPLPSISSVSPSSGSTAGGTTVTISGENLDATTGVSFGSTPAPSFTVVSANMVTAVSPSASAGTVDITIKNPGPSPAVAADRFTFVAPPTPPTPPTPPVPPVVTATVSGLRVSPHKFSLAGRKVNGKCVNPTTKNNANKHCKRPIQLRVSYTLDSAATVTFTLKRETPGRKVNGQCVKPTKKNKTHKSCNRLVTVRGTITQTGKLGANSFTFNGKLDGYKLAPGSYQLTATPTGGKPHTTTLKIVR